VSKPVRVCQLSGCGLVLDGQRRKFCSDGHQRLASVRRVRAKRVGERALEEVVKPINGPLRVEVAADGRVSARKAPPSFVEDGWFGWVAEGVMSFEQCARKLGVTQATVSRWFEWVRREMEVDRQRAGWERPVEAVMALSDFRMFRERYFRVARGPAEVKGKPPVTTVFHERWIHAILEALPEESGGTGEPGRGGQLAICSPPRHGKSLLLAHFVVWLILRNPDICILWSGPSDSIAKRFGSLVRDELEGNGLLIREMLGPGGSFKPDARSGKQWRDDEFEVATRTIPQPAPTVKCVGKTGRILSMDVDLLIGDDFEDQESTSTPSGREAIRNRFFTDLASRKEEHTAWVYIGSRQHPDDLLGTLIESDEWQVIVESAHDEGCELPIDDEEAHVECVLWPEVRPYRFLMQKHRTVGDTIFEMQYLSRPRSGKLTIFDEEVMRACVDRSRNLGEVVIPPGYELLGSIDPSPSVNQIAQLWAWSRDNPVRYLLDIHTGKGGIDAWETLVKFWLDKYGLRRWVVEDNATQADYVNRRDFVQWRQDHGVYVTGHTTGRNKHRMGIGVASMYPLYVNRHIVLPYGDQETRGKIDAFLTEHRNYDPDRSQTSRHRADRVAAAWFAQMYVDSLQGGRLDARIEDSTPKWMAPTGVGWLEEDYSGGWL
jgi:hypothetical protein